MGFISKEDLTAVLTNLNTKLKKKPTAVRLTQAEYDALTEEEIHDTSKTYYVTDGASPSPSGGGDYEVLIDDTWTTAEYNDHKKTIDINSDEILSKYRAFIIQSGKIYNSTFKNVWKSYFIPITPDMVASSLPSESFRGPWFLFDESVIYKHFGTRISGNKPATTGVLTYRFVVNGGMTSNKLTVLVGTCTYRYDWSVTEKSNDYTYVEMDYKYDESTESTYFITVYGVPK